MTVNQIGVKDSVVPQLVATEYANQNDNQDKSVLADTTPPVLVENVRV